MRPFENGFLTDLLDFFTTLKSITCKKSWINILAHKDGNSNLVIFLFDSIWDRLVMEETEMLVFTLISFIESCKEEQLKLINQVDFKTIPRIKLLVVDECKILKTTVKYYKSCHSSPSLPTSILNYLNSTSK